MNIPDPYNIHLGSLCFIIGGICIFLIIKGIAQKRPPGQIGIAGTPLANSKQLMIMQIILLCILAVCSFAAGIVLFSMN